MLISPDTLFLFIPATAISAVSPGPDMLYILSRSIGKTRWSGLIAATGIATGLLLYTLFVALGLAELFEHFPIAYTIVKWVGATYLFYLAIAMVLAKSERIRVKEKASQSYLKIYVRGVLVNILNPKAMLFFIAFLPAFINHEQGYVQQQLFTLAVMAAVIVYICHSASALAAHAVTQRLKSKAGPKFMRIQNYIIAALFMAVAVKLALSETPAG